MIQLDFTLNVKNQIKKTQCPAVLPETEKTL